MKKKAVVTMPELQAMMKSEKTFLTIEQALKACNNGKNQDIKSKFVGREVYCNVNSLVEYIISKGFEDSNAPFTLDDVENYYSLPEWSETLLGESLYFAGGSDSDRDTFVEENFARLADESEDLFNDDKISEETHERNLELIKEAESEVMNLESEPAEIFEWWAVSEYLYRKLKEQGCPVVDAGSCYLWGRCTTGQAILLDGVISRICADMGILAGQKNAWS